MQLVVKGLLYAEFFLRYAELGLQLIILYFYGASINGENNAKRMFSIFLISYILFYFNSRCFGLGTVVLIIYITGAINC